MVDFRVIWQLYSTFVRIGGFTLGGGYAMIPIIQREAVDIKGWATEEEMSDMITLAQSMPGVIGINAATALGAKVAGLPGSVAATLGMVTPSVIVIILIAAVFHEFQKIKTVQYAFVGIRAAVAALMVNAVLKLMKTGVRDWLQIVLFSGAVVCVLAFGIALQYILLGAAAVSIVFSILGFNKKGGKA